MRIQAVIPHTVRHRSLILALPRRCAACVACISDVITFWLTMPVQHVLRVKSTLACTIQRAEGLARRLEATEEEVMVLGQSLRQAEAAQRDTHSEAQLQQVPQNVPCSERHITSMEGYLHFML